ncbi:unnamed protein product [Ophioblennius macclurei]
MDPGAVPPYGHLMCCEKWRDSTLLQQLKDGGVKILFEDKLDVADFHLPCKTKILYVSECDMIAANSYKRKLVRFRNINSSFQKLVLVEQTQLSEQYFFAVQKFVSFDLGLPLLMVRGQAEASQLIAQMILTEGRDNPFRRKAPSQIREPSVMAVVRRIPGVGRVKALALLQKFPSIRDICNASVEQLEPVVGQATARQIHEFLHRESAAGTLRKCVEHH